MRKIAILVFLVILSNLSSCAGGHPDAQSRTVAFSRAAATIEGSRRTLTAYIVEDVADWSFAEGAYLPVATAAYFPTPFSISAKERKLSFDRDLSYRIVSKTALSAGVRLYTIEAAVPSGKERPEGGRSYVFSFPRSALGKSGGAALQPAQFALERAIRIASASKGVAHLESLSFDESTALFKASVNVTAHSISK